jgi:lysophospholipase L1-like esterase
MQQGMLRFFASLAAMVWLLGPGAAAGAADDMLQDRNGDGVVSFIGYGDSITWGMGDGTSPGQSVSEPPLTDGSMGYLARLTQWLGIPTKNAGRPGEALTTQGIFRLPGTLLASRADIVGFLEGINDVFEQARPFEYEVSYQRAVNVSLALGKQPLLMTMPVPCCDHGGERPYAALVSNKVREISALNALPFVDLERAWRTTCQDQRACELLCRPDGLHPNSKGYDVVAQTVAASLFGIDIFAADGAAELEAALGWQPGAVIVKPDINGVK